MKFKCNLSIFWPHGPVTQKRTMYKIWLLPKTTFQLFIIQTSNLQFRKWQAKFKREKSPKIVKHSSTSKRHMRVATFWPKNHFHLKKNHEFLRIINCEVKKYVTPCRGDGIKCARNCTHTFWKIGNSNKLSTEKRILNIRQKLTELEAKM